MSKGKILVTCGGIIGATHMIRAAAHDEIIKGCKKLNSESANKKFIQQKMQGKRRVY